MYRILPLLNSAEVAECRRIAANTNFIDGRATNPHNKAKNNQQLHDPGGQPGQLANHAQGFRPKRGIPRVRLSRQ